jgi:hypothetical protein
VANNRSSSASGDGAEQAPSTQDLIDETGFCKRCLGETTSRSAGDLRTINGFGLRFYGSTEKCRECYSVIRALWVVFAFIPVIPLGTYRYQELANAIIVRRFLTRQTRKTRWPMVLTHWLGLAALLVLLVLLRWEGGAAAGAHERPLTEGERAEIQGSLDRARGRAEAAQQAWRRGIEEAVGQEVGPKADLGECPVNVPRPSSVDDRAPIWLNRIKGPPPRMSSAWSMDPGATCNWMSGYEKVAEDPELAPGARLPPGTAARLLEQAKALEATDLPWEVTFLIETEAPSGAVVGRTYLYDYRTKKVECAGRVSVTTSDGLKPGYREPSPGDNPARSEGERRRRDLRISMHRQVADSVSFRAGPVGGDR